MAAKQSSIRFIDIAANLTDAMFSGFYNGKQVHPPDMASVLNRAWKAGVDRIIVTGGSLEESRQALALAETDPRLFCTVGVHPTRCLEFEQSGDPEGHLRSLLELAKIGASRGKVVAIGECGLDYDRTQFCPPDIQKKWFERQFQLAESTSLPMFLHMRAACVDFLEIVRRNKHKLTHGVVHSFTGSPEDRDQVLALPKLFIGVNGCSLKTEENLAAMAGIPASRLMLETDSPYCDIRPTHAGSSQVATTWPSKKKEKHESDCTVKGRNEPCQIRQVFEVVVGYRKETDQVAFGRKVYENSCRVFFPHDMDSLAGAVLDGSLTT